MFKKFFSAFNASNAKDRWGQDALDEEERLQNHIKWQDYMKRHRREIIAMENVDT